ncbi:rod shape-determining protein [Candidatus Dojkabacteria bacterium]|uniref:Cell shape-determining protein MreB n=1 Tax=Candidatus Dojkabacteria bacterium TaxID=2099670 RepID=A0A955RKK3_9BACT|nr:rod shape-determining protein [Candidatus Dojkabacteria bacterium]
MKKLLDFFLYDIGIDLGTANTLVVVKGVGQMLNEPSVVALNKITGEILAVGEEARHMIGRTPSHIVSVSPLQDGVIHDFDTTEAMIRYFIKRAYGLVGGVLRLKRPRVVIGIPSQVTEVEMRAVVDAAKSAGASKVYLIEAPMAAAIGARVPINQAHGSMVIDIGGGTTDIVVISLGGIIVDKSIRVAGNEMDRAILMYVKKKYNLLIGKAMAEDVKIMLGSAGGKGRGGEVEVKGRDLLTGLPKSLKLTEQEVSEAIVPVLDKILVAAKKALEEAPPEIVADFIDSGVYLTGGGALIRNVAEYFTKKLKVKVVAVSDPLTSVVRGTELLLDEIELLEKVKIDYDAII